MSDWPQQLAELIHPAVARSRATDEVLVAAGALREAGTLATRATSQRRALIMADEAGFRAAGRATVNALISAGFKTETLVLPIAPLPKASVEEAEPFRVALAADPELFPVSVGSGVINDLVKYAAFQTDRRYMAVATAASMDGYTSAGAPLARNGFKITLPVRAPAALLADLDVIAAAPTEMNGWGYGDLAGKIPSGGDWIIADAVEAESIDDITWPLVQDHLRGWLAEPGGILAGDINAVARLFIGLTTVGFAMEFYGSSRPASGADHQIAHLWEMEGLCHNGRKVSHGAAVAVAGVATLALYDWLLRQDVCALDADAVIAGAPDLETRLRTLRTDIPNEAIAAQAATEVRAKHLEAHAHRKRLLRLKSVWPALKTRLTDHLFRHDEMATLLTAAGTPAFAHQIGVSPGHMLQTLQAALHIRRRYTVLDLLHETGLTKDALTDILKWIGPQRTEAVE